MRLQQLHLLQAIAQTGSLRASADLLNVTQPALTKALRQLEEEFGTALVLRSPKGVRLTPPGELLAARANTALRELDRAREEVEWHLRHARAQVTIGVSPVAAILLAPGALERFSVRWPQVVLRVRDTLYPRALEQLRAGELDLALGPLPIEGFRRDLLVHPLFESRIVIAARRGHPLAAETTLAGLANADWVLTGPAGGPGDPRNLCNEAQVELTPKVRLECESFATLLALMPRMDVVGIMPKGFFDRHGPAMDLLELPIGDALPTTTIHAVYRADAPLTVPAQRLLETFTAEAAAQNAQRGAR
ncbi:LysR family transcriptional regulator [Paraburkholderia antibiotica]|uniref:LysR family transcriptional regulator n=1 Tax=Paraburkholderia antibiotica TaxID=2728839 RepID=A0A7X9X5K6_9BURK|nr:LysR substrate-binding domain-containing protein [Paraburkholderia antibiotica]NML31861.1 LysR family transcriptional regulator [Paraburkholderia antibiotica]